MNVCHIFLQNERETLLMGKRFAQLITQPCVIFLFGPLGAGKTTLVRGFLRALGYKGSVKSPTYTLVEPYHLLNQLIYHFDLYRLDNPKELELIGARDYFEHSICFIEWPEKGKDYLPVPDINCYLADQDSGRMLQCEGISAVGKGILEHLVS